jgi:hypothetical protein
MPCRFWRTGAFLPQPRPRTGGQNRGDHSEQVLHELIAKDDSSKSSQGKREIDTADRQHGDDLWPYDREAGAAIEHALRERDEMGRRADDLHDVLQPDRNAVPVHSKVHPGGSVFAEISAIAASAVPDATPGAGLPLIVTER